LLKHLLPKGEGLKAVVSKNITALFNAISAGYQQIRTYIDLFFLDGNPTDTRELARWEVQWGLPTVASLTEDQRRDRLDAAWKALGGQGKDYIQGVLQAAGFPVYLHEWWGDAFDPYDAWYCKDAGAECGETGVECINPIPTTNDPSDTGGYLLVNKIPDTEITTFTADPQSFPYYLYIGGEDFGDSVELPAARRDEFERLCLKLKPCHMWLCILVTYA
jgi:hypothetical protein